MHPIPLKLRSEMSEDPYYSMCARSGPNCKGRITWEHCWTYAGRQIQEKWAIIPLCEWHHLGGGMDKFVNQYISLCRATPEELKKYPRVDWEQEKKRCLYLIIKKYGKGQNIFWIGVGRTVSA